jgi:hypothetical protein
VLLDMGLDLVLCLNPLVPFAPGCRPPPRAGQRAARIPHLVDGGLPVVLSQTFRSLIHSRLELGMKGYEASHPGTDILLFEPDQRDPEMFLANTFAYSQRRCWPNTPTSRRGPTCAPAAATWPPRWPRTACAGPRGAGRPAAPAAGPRHAGDGDNLRVPAHAPLQRLDEVLAALALGRHGTGHHQHDLEPAAARQARFSPGSALQVRLEVRRVQHLAAGALRQFVGGPAAGLGPDVVAQPVEHRPGRRRDVASRSGMVRRIAANHCAAYIAPSE